MNEARHTSLTSYLLQREEQLAKELKEKSKLKDKLTVDLNTCNANLISIERELTAVRGKKDESN